MLVALKRTYHCVWGGEVLKGQESILPLSQYRRREACPMRLLGGKGSPCDPLPPTGEPLYPQWMSSMDPLQ